MAAAAEELRRTRKALADVQGSLGVLVSAAAALLPRGVRACMPAACIPATDAEPLALPALHLQERGVAADAARFAALQRQEAAEHEAAALAQAHASLLQQACSQADADVAAAAEAASGAAEQLGVARSAVAQCQRELAAAQASLAEQRGQGAGAGELLPLQQRLAEAEEEVRLLEQRLQRQRQLEAGLEQQRAAAARAEAGAAAAAAELAAAQQARQAVERQAQQAQSAASARALQDSIAAEVEQLHAALTAKQSALAMSASQVEAASSRLAELQSEQQRLQAAQPASGSGGDSADLAALQAQTRQQADTLSQLRRQEQRLTADVGTLAARLGGGSGAGWRPLHRCFRFHDPASSLQHAQALQVVAGGRLSVLVADSTAVAGRLLEGGAPAGARIWPLDGLVARDHSAAQRAAAQHFPPGAGCGSGWSLLQACVQAVGGQHASTLAPFCRQRSIQRSPCRPGGAAAGSAGGGGALAPRPAARLWLPRAGRRRCW